MNFGKQEKIWRCGGSNPGLFACKANTLPLSYIPCSDCEVVNVHIKYMKTEQYDNN